jgi:hypothetical protein
LEPEDSPPPVARLEHRGILGLLLFRLSLLPDGFSGRPALLVSEPAVRGEAGVHLERDDRLLRVLIEYPVHLHVVPEPIQDSLDLANPIAHVSQGEELGLILGGTGRRRLRRGLGGCPLSIRCRHVARCARRERDQPGDDEGGHLSHRDITRRHARAASAPAPAVHATSTVTAEAGIGPPPAMLQPTSTTP